MDSMKYWLYVPPKTLYNGLLLDTIAAMSSWSSVPTRFVAVTFWLLAITILGLILAARFIPMAIDPTQTACFQSVTRRLFHAGAETVPAFSYATTTLRPAPT